MTRLSPTRSVSPSGAADRAAQLRLLGAVLLIATPVAMWLANRSSPLMLALAAAALLSAALLSDGRSALLHRARSALTSPVGLSLALFLIWALVSVAWSHRVAPALAMWGELVLPLACGVAIMISRQLKPDLLFARALALALIAASLLMLLELWLGLDARIALGLGKAINRTDVFNRPVLTCLILAAVVLPLLWTPSPTQRRDRLLAVVTALAVAGAIVVSESGAAKLGLIILAATWGATLLLPRLMLAAVTLGFLATMLTAPVIGELVDAVMPASLHQKLEDAHSRARVDIWLSFGEAARARPVTGSGFGASTTLDRHPVAQAVSAPHREMLAVGHPHSAAVQAWVETGAIGALLLTIAGLGFLVRMRRLSPADLAPRLALFAATFAIASVGHGAWQGWWIAALTMAAMLFSLTMPQPELRPADQDTDHG